MLNGMYIHIIKNILYVYFGIFVIFKNILCVCIDIRVVYLYIWLIETRYTNFKTNIYRIYVMNNQKIEHQSVIVFTSESKDSLVKNGGSRAWRAVLSKLEQAEYLILVRFGILKLLKMIENLYKFLNMHFYRMMLYLKKHGSG